MHDGLAKSGRIAVSVVLVAVIVLSGVLSVPGVIGAKASFVVLSGSMDPTLQPGDMVIVRSADTSDVQRGDVITFYEPGEPKRGQNRITHRVVGKERTAQGVVYRTKGDDNEHRDPVPVEHSRVVGKVWFHVPVVGRAALFIQSSGLQPLLLVGAGLLLVGTGIKTLSAELADAGGGE
jgi:signal peptidase